jgi:hypothetical protein
VRYIGNEKVGCSIHRGSNFTQFRVLWRSGLWIVETCSISVLEIWRLLASRITQQ